MSQNYTYTAQSVEIGYYIISTKDDKPDQVVATADGNGGIPTSSQTLTFDKALGSITTDVTIKGINGMYVALPKNATSGSKLIWSKDAANWQVDMTSPGVVWSVRIIPKGQDLYWITNQTVGQIVEVKDGKDIIGNENKWTLKMLVG